MWSRTLLSSVVALTAVTASWLTLSGARREPTMERVDFGKTITATVPAYDARVSPVTDPAIKEFVIPITHDTIEIAKGVKYEGWTFGGTVPGPVIRVREGDRVRIKTINKSPMPHSIDFHAARIPANVAYRMINAGDSLSFEFTATDPGAYMVHCGTPPVTMHIMQGMYLPIIIDPRNGWGTKADKEFILLQSEFYAKPGEPAKVESAAPTMLPDWDAQRAKNATYVAFNGRAMQYKDNPLSVDVGDRVRFFVVNAGPNFDSDFHIVGAVFDRVYPDGDPKHVLTGVQTYGVPAGGGAVFEATFEKDASGEGLYPFVTHSFADAEKGAVGIIKVGAPKQFAHMDH
jgi:nitrite reductase (NO-forming)